MADGMKLIVIPPGVAVRVRISRFFQCRCQRKREEGVKLDGGVSPHTEHGSKI
jgi:hypothetical protein